MSASFEHSAMKSSFSLSSLRSAPAPPARSDHLERPYHSLTKKRKEPCREAWRRSWGSAASGSAGDDLWPLLQHHYDYIMDNHLIDTCNEANGELLSNKQPALLPRLNPAAGFNRQWSLSQLVAEFGELCQWLTQVQEEIYSSPENLSSRKLRTSRMTELASVEPRRAKFIEQASAILERIPEASAEVAWRVDHLNAKWEGLRLLLSPEQPQRDGEGTDTVDTSHELRCLRRWLHGMEGRLPPPSLAAARAAPYHELLRKLREHEFSENTFKNFYYPEIKDDSSDEEGTVGLKIKQAIAKKRQANNIDSFFERPQKKTKVVKRSSNVCKSSNDGVTYLSSGQDDGAYASHLIKIEVYDMDKIRNIAPEEHWKHCDIRMKYYSCAEDDSNVQSARDVIYNVTKQLASKENCTKYFIDSKKK